MICQRRRRRRNELFIYLGTVIKRNYESVVCVSIKKSENDEVLLEKRVIE
jgi:hypothetical protein